jgi:cytochrome P450
MAGILSPTIVTSSYRPLIEASIDRFFGDLKSSSSTSDSFQPMVPRMRSFFIKLMLQVVLGTEDCNSAEVERLASDIEIWSTGLLAPPLTFIPWSTARRAMRARKRIASMLLDWMINGPISTGAFVRERGVLYKLMLAKDENGEKLSDEEILDNVLTLLFAGSDTTASAAISLWKVLSEDPEGESLQRDLLNSSDEDLEQFVLNVLAK